MTDKADDKNKVEDAVERYLLGDSQISRLYSTSKQECLPQEVASKVWAELENELLRQPTTATNAPSGSWYIPLGLAAGIALTVGILLINLGAENISPLKNASVATEPVIEISGETQYSEPNKGISVTQIKSTDQSNQVKNEAPSQSASAGKINQPIQEQIAKKIESIALQDISNSELLKDRYQKDNAIISQAGPPPEAIAELQEPPIAHELLQNVSDGPVKSSDIPAEISSADGLAVGVSDQSNALESLDIVSDLLQPLGDTNTNNTNAKNLPADLVQPLTNSSAGEQAQLARDQWLDKIVRLYKDDKTAEGDAASRLFKQSYPDFPLKKYLKERLNN